MKEIKAIIRPFKLTQVISELNKIDGLPGLTVTETKGFGKSKGLHVDKAGGNDLFEFVPKMQIELVVPDEMVDVILSTIQTFAHTGNPGDGKIFVYTVDKIVKIRTNERGIKAI